MPDDEFESVREALIAKKLEKPKRLDARVDRYWAQVTAQRYCFHKPELECDELKKVTKEEVLQFHDKYISADRFV